MSREDRNRLGYTVALISEFAARFGIQPRQAYAYMKRFGSMRITECSTHSRLMMALKS